MLGPVTTIFVSDPLIVGAFKSLAVSVWVPAVLKTALNAPKPLVNVTSGGKVAPVPSMGCGKASPQTGSSSSPLMVSGHQYYVKLPTNYGDRYGVQFQRVFEDVAKKRGALLMPFFLDGVGGVAALNQPDGIHPTAEGYRLVVDRLWPYLRPLLKQP